jgi:hypothetical protein
MTAPSEQGKWPVKRGRRVVHDLSVGQEPEEAGNSGLSLMDADSPVISEIRRLDYS